MSLRDHVAILDFPRQGRLVDFWSSTFFDHFHHGIFWQWCLNIFVHQCTIHAMLYVSQESFSCLGFAETRPDHEFLVFYFSFIHHRPLRFHLPSIAALSSTIDDRYATLSFTIDPRTCIHHRPLRFHSPLTAPLSFSLICSVSGYVKFLSKGKHIKSWYICGHVWILAKGQTRFVLIYTAGTVQK